MEVLFFGKSGEAGAAAQSFHEISFYAHANFVGRRFGLGMFANGPNAWTGRRWAA